MKITALYFKKNKQLFYNNLKQKGLYFLFFLFLLTNSLKIAIFNAELFHFSIKFLIYKTSCNLFIFSFIWMLIFRSGKKWFLLIYLLQICYIVINLVYYFSFNSYIQIAQCLTLYKETISTIGNSGLPVDKRLLLTVIDIPCLLLVLSNYKKIKLLLSKKVILTSFVIGIVFFICLDNRNHNKDRRSLHNLLSNTCSGETDIIKYYGTLFNTIINFFSSGERLVINGFKYGKEIKFENKNNKNNILIIQIESLDANIINKTYNGKKIMPYLTSLTDSSIYYKYMLSFHAAGCSSDAEFSALNSIEPSWQYPSMKLHSYTYPNSVIKKLKSEFICYAFHNNRAIFFNRNIAYAKMGFDSFYDLDALHLCEETWGATDSCVFEKVLEYQSRIIKSEKKPYLFYIISMSSHEPFNRVNKYYHNKEYDNIKNETVKNYYNSFSYVDNQLKKLITNAKKNDSTLSIIIYGDHAPLFFNDTAAIKIIQPAISYIDENKFEYVPLFILTAKKMCFYDTAEAACLLDIAPTIINLTGIATEYKTSGQNLITYPLQNDEILYKGKKYTRKFLFALAEKNIVPGNK
jgi:lipoteichoic acid synthase